MTCTRTLVSLIAVSIGLSAATPGFAGSPKEVSKDIIAVQIRKQGFACKNPESAVRDEAASKPDADVWTLACEGVSYKVKLIPNMAADVEKLPDDQNANQQP